MEAQRPEVQSSAQDSETIYSTTEYRTPRWRRQNILYLVFKRSFDIISSIFLLAVIWPLFIVVAVFIKLDSPGSILYLHPRIGYKGKKINLLKFRTMYKNSSEIFESMPQELKDKFQREWKLETDENPRITPIGKFLRRTSIDELPQLLNIIIGDLSVVGPRPVVEKELEEKYGDRADELLSRAPVRCKRNRKVKVLPR
jgi:lipopolysaccharide/colanic/teichoic acid biosynthesis glycosyltransferase